MMCIIELIGGPCDGLAFYGRPIPGLIWKHGRHVYVTQGFTAVYQGLTQSTT